MLGNKDTGCSIHGLEFNRHGRAQLMRAAQEGIVFSFQYGIEIMEQMGLKVDKIHAGKANMFQSKIFRDTLSGVSGATIELYETDGAAGAAKGAGMGAGIYKDHAGGLLHPGAPGRHPNRSTRRNTARPTKMEIIQYKTLTKLWQKNISRQSAKFPLKDLRARIPLLSITMSRSALSAANP